MKKYIIILGSKKNTSLFWEAKKFFVFSYIFFFYDSFFAF